MRDLIAREGELAEIRRRVQFILENRGSRGRMVQEERTHRLAALLERRRRICEMREDGTYEPALFRERLAVIDREVASLNESRVAPAELSTIDPDELSASVDWMLARAALWWEKVPTESRPRFEKLLFPDGIRLDSRSGLRTTKPGLILALFGRQYSQSSLKVHLEGFSANLLYETFSEVISLHHESETQPEQADFLSAA